MNESGIAKAFWNCGLSFSSEFKIGEVVGSALSVGEFFT